MKTLLIAGIVSMAVSHSYSLNRKNTENDKLGFSGRIISEDFQFSLIGYQINVTDKWEGQYFSVGEVYLGHGYFGFSFPAISLEFSEIGHNQKAFNSNFLLTLPIAVYSSYAKTTNPIGIYLLNLPAVLQKPTLYITTPNRLIALSQSFQNDVFLFTKDKGFMSKSSTGIEFGFKESVYLTFGFVVNKLVYQTFQENPDRISFGLNMKLWMDLE